MPEPLTPHDYAAAAAALGCSAATVRAFAEVESGPLGGFLPDGQPTILYEPHVFHRLTAGRFASETVAIGPTRWPLSYPKWRTKPYGPTGIQHTKLAAAVRLDRSAALQSCSWGRFQIMGFNWQACGFASVQEFVNAMYEGERQHLIAFVAFCKSKGLGPILARRDWPRAVGIYNGPGQVAAYTKRLRAAHDRYAGEGAP